MVSVVSLKKAMRAFPVASASIDSCAVNLTPCDRRANSGVCKATARCWDKRERGESEFRLSLIETFEDYDWAMPETCGGFEFWKESAF